MADGVRGRVARAPAVPALARVQLQHRRFELAGDEQVRLDIEYIERQSIWMDLNIVVKTPLAVLFGRGAY